jgi:AcrR family transcriptional regulator
MRPHSRRNGIPRTTPTDAEPPRTSLDTKLAPSQDRARATFELILETTGKLLAEVGVDNLSTNMICERAGLTPPAIYRYFPNKYAILHELGRRLMAAEDEVVFEWLERDAVPLDSDFEAAVASRAAMLANVRKVVRAQPGGAWILRALHAVPMLHDVRTASVTAVARRIFKALRKDHPDVDTRRLKVATMLTTWLGAAANEIVLDNPRLERQLTREVARMFTLYYRDLVENGAERT